MVIIASPISLRQNHLDTKLFSATIEHYLENIAITLVVNCNALTTGKLPKTTKILKKRLPSVLKSKCFNEAKLPFYQEVKNTEIGHLFEHILLEYLCLEKLKKGKKYASYSGVTKWDWIKETKGTFNINVQCPDTDSDIFPTALAKTAALTSTILSETN